METRILDLVAGIDPVPDESALLAGEGEFEATRRLVKERSIMLQPAIETTEPDEHGRRTSESDVPFDELAARRRNRIWVTAVALSAAAAVVLVVAIVGGAFDSAGESDVVDSPDTDVTVDSEEAAFAAEAMDAAESYLAALDSGDVDTLMELAAPSDSLDADRLMWEFNAAFSERGMGLTTTGCEQQMGNDQVVVIECTSISADPVQLALGVEEQVSPVYYRENGLEWGPAYGDGLADASRAFRTYLSDRYPDEYDAVCDPTGYDARSINQNAGLALTGPCGEFAATHAEEVAQWIRDGRPDS